MGELITKGCAEKVLECDVVVYTFRFTAQGEEPSSAVSAVNSNLEKFLTVMNSDDYCIEPSCFKTVSHSVERSPSYIANDEVKYTATHSVSLRLELSVGFSTMLYETIASSNLNVEVTEKYFCTACAKEHEELLRLAINNARAKAERIADLSGCKIAGIKKIDIDPEELDICECERAIAAPLTLSDKKMSKLQSPSSCESEIVEIVWELENI